VRILLIACRVTASAASPALIPEPSSRARIISDPPPAISTSTREAPASCEFSTSSFTAEAGRSMISPAAMPHATSSSSTRTRPGPSTSSEP
jgi:hypothetical protein